MGFWERFDGEVEWMAKGLGVGVGRAMDGGGGLLAVIWGLAGAYGTPDGQGWGWVSSFHNIRHNIAMDLGCRSKSGIFLTNRNDPTSSNL